MTDPAHASPTPEQMEMASKIARRVLADKVWKEARQRFINDATQADFEAHLVVVAGMHAALTAILQSDQQQAELLAHAEAMAGALEQANEAIKEMFRYYDGGETRSSYDGMLARNQLRKAGYACPGPLTAFREYQKGRSDG